MTTTNTTTNTTTTTKPVFQTAVEAAENCFEIPNRRRVVAKVREGAFTICSRSKARRLGFEIVTRNY